MSIGINQGWGDWGLLEKGRCLGGTYGCLGGGGYQPEGRCPGRGVNWGATSSRGFAWRVAELFCATHRHPYVTLEYGYNIIARVWIKEVLLLKASKSYHVEVTVIVKLKYPCKIYLSISIGSVGCCKLVQGHWCEIYYLTNSALAFKIVHFLSIR